MVDVEFVDVLPAFVSLEALKADEKLDGMLVRQRRDAPVGAAGGGGALQAGAAARQVHAPWRAARPRAPKIDIQKNLFGVFWRLGGSSSIRRALRLASSRAGAA